MLTKFDHVTLLVNIFQWLAVTYRIKDKLNYTLIGYLLLQPQLKPHIPRIPVAETFFVCSYSKDLWFEALLHTCSLYHEINHIFLDKFWQKALPYNNFTETFGWGNKAFKALYNLSPIYFQCDFSKSSTQTTQIYTLSFLETYLMLCHFKVSAHAIPLMWNPLPLSLFLSRT